MTGRGVFALAALAAVLAGPIAAAAQEAPQVVHDTAWHNAQRAALARLDPAAGWRVLPDGVALRRIAGDGSGARPTLADRVTVHYRGSFIDGTVFDSSLDRGEPATFPLARLIRGWQVAIPEMGVGDRYEIVIPADLAYGPLGKGPIPGNATLLFTIELLGINPPE